MASKKHLIPNGEALCTVVTGVMSNVQVFVDQKILRHRKGRPAIHIPEEQLAMLLENHFSETEIAQMLHVSPRTIRRRVIQYDFEHYTAFSDISNALLDEITTQFVQSHPYSFLRFLRSTGLHIQLARIRESLRHVDSRAMNSRFRMALHRRTF